SRLMDRPARQDDADCNDTRYLHIIIMCVRCVYARARTRFLYRRVPEPPVSTARGYGSSCRKPLSGERPGARAGQPVTASIAGWLTWVAPRAYIRCSCRSYSTYDALAHPPNDTRPADGLFVHPMLRASVASELLAGG